jgi:hypothetical protein
MTRRVGVQLAVAVPLVSAGIRQFNSMLRSDVLYIVAIAVCTTGREQAS